MKKTYKSKQTTPHFAVGNYRVAFTTTTMGNSYFTTDDEQLQKLMEAHPWYGKKYKLDKVEEDKKPVAVLSADESKEQEHPTPIHAGKEGAELFGGGEVIQRFDCLADAKDFLAKTFGAARSNIRSKDAAIETGKSYGISIVFTN